jgi:hypothetical protein
MMSRRTMALGMAAGGAIAAMPGLVSAAAELPALELPPPAQHGGKPLMEALMLRRSTRAYAPTPLPPQLLQTCSGPPMASTAPAASEPRRIGGISW